MKYVKFVLALLIAPAFANADILLEREFFNARNGESYVCKIHSTGKTELINEGISVGEFNTEFSSSADNVKKWISEMKALLKGNKFTMESKPITNYTHRGLKQYSLYNGGKKLVFYTLAANSKAVKKAGGKRAPLGSTEQKVKNDKSNVNRLRGQTDYACKRALATL